MKKFGMNMMMLGALAVSAALFGCSSPHSSSPAVPADSIDGTALYIADCSGCHGPLATSGKKNATTDMIHSAISNNFGGMGSFVTLSDAQIQAIADALATTASSTQTPSSTPTTTIAWP